MASLCIDYKSPFTILDMYFVSLLESENTIFVHTLDCCSVSNFISMSLGLYIRSDKKNYVQTPLTIGKPQLKQMRRGTNCRNILFYFLCLSVQLYCPFFLANKHISRSVIEWGHDERQPLPLLDPSILIKLPLLFSYV